MELPDFIKLGNEAPALRFLVIGGWAVGADDVEVLLRRHQIDWSILITKPFFSSMEHSNSTKPLSNSCAIRDAARPSLDFDLPDPEGFTSLPTEVSPARMLKGIRQMRAWFPAGLRTAEERWRSKSNQEFIL